MLPSPSSPSPFVPGAWPTSPSPTSRLRRPGGSLGEPHYLRSRQHTPDSHYRKVATQCVSHSCCNSRKGPPTEQTRNPNLSSRSALPTPSTSDNTPTNFTSGSPSLQSSPANTSLSSAYTGITPLIFSLSPNKLAKPKQNDKTKPLRNQETDTQYQFPRRGVHDYDLPEVLEADQTFLSLPEIPDLSSLSSLKEEFQISREEFKASNSGLPPQFYLNETHTFSFQHECLDIKPPSSSIRFRQSGFLPAPSSLEPAVEILQFPQPDGRNSWTLFLSPTPTRSEESSFPELARTSPGSTAPDSGCRAPSSTSLHAPKNWRFLSGDQLQQEESSARRYANDVLDHAFNLNGGAFTSGFGASAVGSAYSAHPGPHPVKNLKVSSSDPVYNNIASPVGPWRRVYFLRAVKRIRKKLHWVFAKLKTRDVETTKPQEEIVRPVRPHYDDHKPSATRSSVYANSARSIRQTPPSLSSSTFAHPGKQYAQNDICHQDEARPKDSPFKVYNTRVQHRSTTRPASSGLLASCLSPLQPQQVLTPTNIIQDAQLLQKTSKSSRRSPPVTPERPKNKQRRSFLSHINF